MVEHEKFLFEKEFERPSSAVMERIDTREPDAIPVYTEPDLAAARQEAFQEGRDAGLAEARDEIGATVSGAVQDLSGHVIKLLGEVDARAEDIRKEAAELSLQIGRTLAGTLLEREPVPEIEALIQECLGILDPQSSGERLTLRVAPAIADEVRSLAEAIGTETGFTGTIAVKDDEALSGADCRAEWSSGGAERSREAAEAMIEAAVQRYVESSAVVPEPVVAETAAAEPPVAQDPADLHAESKAVKLEDPAPQDTGTDLPVLNETLPAPAEPTENGTAATAASQIPEEPEAPSGQ